MFEILPEKIVTINLMDKNQLKIDEKYIHVNC